MSQSWVNLYKPRYVTYKNTNKKNKKKIRSNIANIYEGIICLKSIDQIRFQDTLMIFQRVMYTLKMIGDHGQVEFCKVLQKLDGFNDNFELLFVTEDSLARLYACVRGISNVSMTQTDFPSDKYCESTPKGMVYFSPQTPQL